MLITNLHLDYADNFHLILSRADNFYFCFKESLPLTIKFPDYEKNIHTLVFWLNPFLSASEFFDGSER
jgi:hypothetical protein